MRVNPPYLNEKVIGSVKKKLLIWVATLLSTCAFAQQPTIASFVPTSGTVGSSVIITGSNFSSTASNNIVYFGSVKANVINASPNSLTVTVPNGSTYQPISVTTNALTGYSNLPFCATFPGGGSITSNNFGQKIDSTTDLHPNGIAIGDFDGDGNPDIATPNNYSIAGQLASVSILRNITNAGSIAFAPRLDLITGVATYAIAAGDLDGDGKLDLVSSSNFDQSMSIFKNTSIIGTISFATKIDYPTGSDPFSIAIADFDGDGKPDIAIANYLSNSISLFKNTSSVGNISFAAKVDYSTGLGPRNIAIGDFDGDGKTDIIVTNQFSNSISILKNNSSLNNISFAPKVDLSTGNSPYGVAVGDLNNDGKSDLVVSNNGTFVFSVFKNTSTIGNITFASKVDFSCASGNYLITISDVNGDGKPDVIIPNSGGSVFNIAENTSSLNNITFSSTVYCSLSPSAFAMSCADFNSDGKPDIAAAIFTSNKVSLLRNKAGEPSIINFSPSTASSGTTVTLTGGNFLGVNSVLFGGVPAASFNIVNSTTIAAIVGTGVSGAIKVSNNIGTDSINGFVFAGPPIISSFTPTTTGLGQTVTISGINFSGTTAVSFGGTAALSFTVVSPTTITAIVSTGATGNVSVTNPYGTSSLAGFTFVPLPLITAFSPITAATGTVVTITGINFTGTTAVSFGGIPAVSFTVNSATSISAVVGNGASGDVSVTTNYGTATRAGFIFIPAPTITSFTPTWGIIGTVVTVYGTNFQNITSVFVGTASYTFSYIYISPSQIQIPINAQGNTGDIIITTPGGTATMPGFVFNPQPFVTSINPSEAGSGMAVTITGTNFTGSTTVTLGGTPVSSFVVNSATSITAVVGTGSSGPVKVTNSYGTNASAPDFTYTTRTIISSFSPVAGPIGTLVNITGGNFNTTAISNHVYFGAVKASVVSATNTSLTVAVPTGATYEKITVTNNNSTAYTLQPFNITFPGGGIPFNATTFAGRIDFATGPNPRQIKLADIDNDGKEDVIINREDTLSVYRNISTNNVMAFAPPYNFKASNIILAIATGDMDGDGKLDIIAVTEYANNSVILKNNSSPGNISLTTAFTFTTGHASTKIAIGDLNNDGKPDIAMSNLETAVASYLQNTSTGGVISFATTYSVNILLPESPADPPLYSHSVLISDFNNDGLQDIVIGSESDHFYFIKNNAPNIFSFTPIRKDIGGSSLLNDFISADFNRDGNMDLISNSFIFKGLGNSNFANFFSNQIGGTGDIADLDGDTLPDFASLKYPFPSIIYVNRNKSTGSGIIFDPSVNYTTGDSPASVAIGDLDNDGRPDIALTNYQSNTFSVLKNQVGTTQVCAGSNISFTSNTTGALYQWQVDSGSGFVNIANNSNYSGTTTITLHLNNIPLNWNAYKYRCVINGNTYSNVNTIIVNSSIVTVSIATPVTSICSGNSVSFTATATNAGTAPSYQWQVNGINTGANSNIFTTSTLNNNDQVSVIITSNSPCSAGALVTSNIIPITVSTIVVPSVNIVTSSTSLCSGTPAAFTAAAVNGGTTPLYQWQVNGINTGFNSNIFTLAALNNNDQVKVVLTSSLSCASPTIATSNVVSITVTPMPVANAGNDVTICSGSSVQLNGSGGATYLWTPSTGLSNPNIANPIASPVATTTYVLTAFNSANCFSRDTMVVAVNQLQAPSVSISTATNSICAASVVSFTATATNGGTNPLYQWKVNGISTATSSNLFITSSLNNNDQVIAILTSNSTCATTPTATSNFITMTVQSPLAVPLVSLSNRIYTVTNPDAGATYTWQTLINNTWGNVIPAATGITYTATAAGEYRAMAVKGPCISYSVSQVTNLVNLPPANNAFGIYLYPNPGATLIKVDSLKLSQNWETLEVINIDGKNILPALTIKNETSVQINISGLAKGTYFIRLRKKDGEFTTLKFVKI